MSDPTGDRPIRVVPSFRPRTENKRKGVKLVKRRRLDRVWSDLDRLTNTLGHPDFDELPLDKTIALRDELHTFRKMLAAADPAKKSGG
jgi:hypothetical protein